MHNFKFYKTRNGKSSYINISITCNNPQIYEYKILTPCHMSHIHNHNLNIIYQQIKVIKETVSTLLNHSLTRLQAKRKRGSFKASPQALTSKANSIRHTVYPFIQIGIQSIKQQLRVRYYST